MLERILKGVLAAALVLSSNCSLQKPKEDLVQKVSTFYFYRSDFIEEEDQPYKTTKADYFYNNGIVAEVSFKRNKYSKKLVIKIIKDSYNILMKDLPLSEMPSDSEYSIIFAEGKISREITFRLFENRIKVSIDNDKMAYEKNDEPSEQIPVLAYGSIHKKVGEIEKNLNVQEHLEMLTELLSKK